LLRWDRPLGINRLRDGDEVVPVAGGTAEERDSLGSASPSFAARNVSRATPDRLRYSGS